MLVLLILLFFLLVALYIFQLLLLAEFNFQLQGHSPIVYEKIGKPNKLVGHYWNGTAKFDKKLMLVVESSVYDNLLDEKSLEIKQRFIKWNLYWKLLLALFLIGFVLHYVSA